MVYGYFSVIEMKNVNHIACIKFSERLNGSLKLKSKKVNVFI